MLNKIRQLSHEFQTADVLTTEGGVVNYDEVLLIYVLSVFSYKISWQWYTQLSRDRHNSFQNVPVPSCHKRAIS